MDPSLEIVPVDPLDPTRDALFAAWHAAQEPTRRHDEGDLASPHTAHELRERARTETVGAADLHRGRARRRVVGALGTEASLADNTHRLDAEIDVVPGRPPPGGGHRAPAAPGGGRPGGRAHRGRRLLDPGRGPAADLARRSRPGTATTSVALRGVNVLELPEGAASLPAVLAPLDAAVAAHGAAGYTLLTFVDEIPDAHLDDRAVLQTRMSTDAPFDGLDCTEEVWDAARVRERIDTLRAQGRRYVETVARHDGTGVLAGFSALAVTPAPRSGRTSGRRSSGRTTAATGWGWR